MAEVARSLRREGQPVEMTLEAVTAAALASVPGADDAGISLVVPHGRVQARGATSDRPKRLDGLQDQLNQGPCLYALREQEIVHIPDMSAEQRWPRFAAAAAQQGVGSMLSLRLYVTEQERLGALNLYADRPHAFDPDVEPDAEVVARLLAVHAAIALAAAEREQQLEAALRSRDRISQAKGILMERFRLTADQAFALLTRVSQRTGRKLVDIAEQIASTGELPGQGRQDDAT